MHDAALKKMTRFVDAYLGGFSNVPLQIVDVVARPLESVDGYRQLFKRQGWHYRTLDTATAENVDLVDDDDCRWSAIGDANVDVVVSGQAVGHIEHPWEAVREIARVLRPAGVACLITPSCGPEHGRTRDCWRIYPDGMRALARFAGLKVVEVFTDWGLGPWQDTFAVLQKPRAPDPAICAPFPDCSDKRAGRSIYIEALPTHPRDPAYYVKLSELLSSDGRAVKAIAALRIGLEVNPGCTELLHKLGEAQLDLGLTGAAAEQAIALLNVRPISPANTEAAAHVFDRLGEIERRMVTETLPADAPALKRIAGLAEAGERFGLAAACRERLAAADPGDYGSLLSWGLALLGSGETEAAKQVFRRARDIQLEGGMINRTTVLQRLIRKMRAKSYLEIGVERGRNFFQIEIAIKFGVDPEFRIPGGARDSAGTRFFSCESDKFFDAFPTQLAEVGVDVVLIDGLHTREQALKDIENSLRFLNPGGIIVMHDCLPASESEACGDLAEARRMPGFSGEWTGDVFKAVVHLRATRADLFVCILDADHGTGLVMRGQPESMVSLSAPELRAIGYDDLRRRPGELLNLKPAHWFDAWLPGTVVCMKEEVPGRLRNAGREAK